MGFTLSSQQLGFVLSLLSGAFLCAVYELFCVFRALAAKSGEKTEHAVTFILDFFFFLFSAVYCAVYFFVVNNGELRIYMLAGIAVGWLCCFFLSKSLSEYYVEKCSYKTRKIERKNMKKP